MKTRTRTAITFDTSDYYNSHLREPRGRGSWAFMLESDFRSGENYFENIKWSPSMTYGEAKKWARKIFPAGSYVMVLS